MLFDSNPLVRYCFDCVELKYDSFGNVKPNKDSNTKKIDIVIAMIEALSARLFEELFAGDMNIITLDL